MCLLQKQNRDVIIVGVKYKLFSVPTHFDGFKENGREELIYLQG